MKQHTSNNQLSGYNLAVKQAYFKLLKVAKQLLATIEHEELRFTLIRDDRNRHTSDSVLHEFVSPLLYMRLECSKQNLFVIHYGIEFIQTDTSLSDRTASFIRAVYHLTSKGITSIDIEKSVSTTWCITVCSELYEYIEEQQKYHTFQLIKHKVTDGQRKRLLSVA